LKEYQFNLHPNENVEVAIMLTLRPLAGGEPVRQPHVVPIGENMYRPMLDGFREGDDARDVLREAIEWWEEELSAIEAALAPK
jgi:hypothetical protein